MSRRVVEVQENVPRDFTRGELDEDFMHEVWSRYSRFVDVEFPSPKTTYRWRLTPKGTVGFLPVGEEGGLILHPKVPVANLFRMLGYAYGLDGFQFLEGAFNCVSLEEFYSILAGELAVRVLRRIRSGLLRDYVPRAEAVHYVRGRIDVGSHVRAPWKPGFHCRFDEHSSDVDDNRLLAWALFLAARTVTGPPDVNVLVRRAYRSMRKLVEIVPFKSSACSNRFYDRLALDYEPMHALSAFVIDHCGPEHARGDRASLPFVVDMSRLFERFVGAVLVRQAGSQATVLLQERVRTLGDELTFVMDILVRDSAGMPLRVVDTKYKNTPTPSAQDVAQVVAYATAVGAREAILVYPKPTQWATAVGPVAVRALGLSLQDDLCKAEELIASLLRVDRAA